jgi:hypothetical protein
MKALGRPWGILVSALLLPATAFADTVDVEPSADTTIHSENASLANGAGSHLFAGLTASGNARRALLAFDLSGIPSGSTITDATLSIAVNKTHPATPLATLGLFRVEEPWAAGTSDALGQEGAGALASSGEATWSHAMLGAMMWADAGGTHAGTASATTDVTGVGDYAWSGAGLAADIQGWLDDPSTNNGWLVRAVNPGSATAKRFGSADNALESERPLLTIEFTPPAAGPACLSIPGDVDDDGSADVTDVNCAIAAAIWMHEGEVDPMPTCVGSDTTRADSDCNGLLTVTDIQVLILQTMASGLPSAIDADDSNCHDACEP